MNASSVDTNSDVTLAFNPSLFDRGLYREAVENYAARKGLAYEEAHRSIKATMRQLENASGSVGT